MELEDAKQEQKRPYEKPKLRAIELAADEVMGVGCKMESAGGGHLPPTCYATSCVAIGS